MVKTLAEEWGLGEIDKLKNTVEWHVKSCVDFEKEVKRLKAQLRKYGGHTRVCGTIGADGLKKCDCGYDEDMKKYVREGE